MDLFHSFDRDDNGYIMVAKLARSMAKMVHAVSFWEITDMIVEIDMTGMEE